MGLTEGKAPFLSWKGLIENGFTYGVTKGKITDTQAASWKAQLNSNDLDDLLSASEFMGRKLEAPEGDLYARWLENLFRDVQPTNTSFQHAIATLRSKEIPLCTLNYDPLLERVTNLPGIDLTEVGKVTAWMRREESSILHIHGVWDNPKTCILGIRDYETTINNELRNLIQRTLASFRRLLFIGCGDTFADPNFSALIKWLKEVLRAAAPEHYALVNEEQLPVRNADSSWHGFVEPVSFGREYSDLPKFISEIFSVSKMVKNSTVIAVSKPKDRPQERSKLLQDYCAFLLRDCGQMTIEGIRADMEISQRRFDLERLFVPLQVLATPPDIPDTDPLRDKKLVDWREKNKEPLSFGKVFSKTKHIALLALPGGGKTLLLKRLAVAYADQTRRANSQDKLPNLNLMPVLIRCREWREHIHRPIPTLLQSLPEITGQPSLKGLSEALMPLFKEGRALLLIDGLDEIHDDATRTIFVEHLERFLGENKLTKLVVTSREAGFSLVAPYLARFCERWKVAPLGEEAVVRLCDYWHRLIVGDSPEAKAEAIEVARYLLRNGSLLRLAENPLLLTMLLVVKHGAGRLPPDRVSLYGRAVEVLMDTWNIRGHDPLIIKEAVPQLAFVAFQMMRAGKQTATERELLSILEEGRDRIPQVKRYAKGTPYEFLKRVELRSSLLVEAGHQIENGLTVPFYQFRHLTFQEYLAAVAVAEGHYIDYNKNDTVLTPLTPYYLSDEWKEVVPMAAVLARKQAESLIAALVSAADVERQKLMGELDQDEGEGSDNPRVLPKPVARLMQCFVEEAEAAPETLASSLKIITLFGKGCHYGSGDWVALARGPYGEELMHQTWLLYKDMQWPDRSSLMDTFQALAAERHTFQYWNSDEGRSELSARLGSQHIEDNVRGIVTIAGLLRNTDRMVARTSKQPIFTTVSPFIQTLELFLAKADVAVWTAAARAIGWYYRNVDTVALPRTDILDRLTTLWLSDARKYSKTRAAYGLLYLVHIPRHYWKPNLTSAERDSLLIAAESDRSNAQPDRRASIMVAFNAGNIWPESELARRIAEVVTSDRGGPPRVHKEFNRMLGELGAVGHKYLASISRKQQVISPSRGKTVYKGKPLN